MRNTPLKRAAVAVAILLPGLVLAQAIWGDLFVNVTDPTGAAVSGAKLALVQTETNTKLEVEADSLGGHVFGQLKPGVYRLTVSMAGFQTVTLDEVQIQVGQKARVDVKLTLGAVTESVTVSAAAATLLNAESASIGQVLQEGTIVQLPLNGRNFIQLAQISAGAAPIGIGVSPATSWTGRLDSTLSLEGGRETNNSFLVNGIETRNSRFGSAGIRPSVEAIEEFRVQRSTFGAEFGRSSAIINTTIRSGTNDLHLTAFEFLRNRDLDANNFFANRSGSEKPPFTQNNFGTAVGGPVRLPGYNGRDKTFWFFNYEGFRQREGIPSTALYPSRAQLAGNLADDSAGTGIFPKSSPFCQANPGSGKCKDVIDPSSGLPFPGNVVPGNRLDPTTQKALPFTPTPNVAVTPGSPDFPNFNTIGFPKRVNDWDQYNVRIDHHLSSRDVVYGTFSNADETLLAPALRPLGGDVFPQSNRLYTVTYSRILSPAMVNEFRFGYNRSETFRQAETSFGRDWAREVFGVKNTSPNPFDFGVPSFGISGGFGGVGSLSEAIGALDKNIQFTDNFSLARGKHNLRLGLQISRQRYFQITDFSGNPSFNFDGRYTGIQGLGIADFLLGIPISASGALGDSSQDMRTTFYGAYIQNDWRLTPSLTLNFGLRYEYAGSPYEVRNKALVFAPEVRTTVVAGKGVRPSIVDPDFNNFAPRVGFAYRPGFVRNTVVRGGFGIYYATDNFNEEQFKVIGPPFYQPQTLNGDPAKPSLFMKDMLPSFAASPNLNPFTFDRSNRTPYLSQWSFGIQHTFGSDYLAEIEYSGSTGQKLPQRRNLNIATLDPTGNIPIKQRVPYPEFGFILMTNNGGWSSYNALTAKLEKRFTRGLSLLASYTFQKSLDLGATDEFSALSVEFKKWDKGHSTFDVPHRFVLSYVYELPLGRGKALGRGLSGFADRLVGGWQVTGITTFSQGQFRTPGLGVDWVNLGAFTQSRPNIIGDIQAGRSLPDHYVNPVAFDFPRDAAGNRIHVEGNAARNSIQMPGINNWDLGLVKNTRAGERLNVQFRWEMFNGFNHTQFGPANLNVTSVSFGKIGGTLVGSRRMQFGLKLIY